MRARNLNSKSGGASTRGCALSSLRSDAASSE
jgi:hypothetical protein